MNAWLELFLILGGTFVIGVTAAYFYNLYRERKLQNYINNHAYLAQQQKELQEAQEQAEQQYDDWMVSVMEEVWGY